MTRTLSGLVAIAIIAAPLLASGVAHAEGGEVKLVRAEKLPNVPGKSITAVVVNYAPGGKSAGHHHAGSVLAYVLTRSEERRVGKEC